MKTLTENEWIDINLKNVAEKQYGKVKFINRNGQSANNHQAKAVIEKLKEEKLADLNLAGGELMERGEKIISEYGGWLKYKEHQEKEDSENKKLNNEVAALTRENLKLQNESFKYKKTIRVQESKISKLDLKLKRFEIIRKWWWLICTILLVLGWLLSFL